MQSIKQTLTYKTVMLALFLGLSVPSIAGDVTRAKPRMIYSEKVVPQEDNKSLELNQKAANQGQVEAQYNLGVMYSEGLGVRQDYQKAFEWYVKAANQNYPLAQNDLGTLYRDGLGVRPNYVESKEWFGKACDNGSQVGCIEYRILNQHTN